VFGGFWDTVLMTEARFSRGARKQRIDIHNPSHPSAGVLLRRQVR
jgi:hypothetical protein